MESCEDYNAEYKDIELSPLETSIALYGARQVKSNVLESMRLQEESRKREAELRRPWNYDELVDFVGYRAISEFGFSSNSGSDGKPVFRIDNDNRDVLKALALYFTNDPEFEKMGDGWNLQKGICLFGGVGLGKTLLMKLFSRNKKQSYYVISSRLVGSLYAEDGHTALYNYSNIKHETYGDPRVFYQTVAGYCFDDLGTEEVKKHYGNQVNVMGEVILNRYDKRDELPWCCTHITTNLSAEDIEQYYGTRVRSRFREMFNAIELGGKDRRK